MKAGRPSFMKMAATALVVVAALVYLNNTSLLVDPIGPGPVLLAHRALGQDFEREGLTGKTCTAARMVPSGHPYLENTLPAMRAAFDYGADIVEFDVHPTTDGKIAVFHDWTLDCRTEGSGVTREHTLEELQKLDVGYGYTADGGKTWPFRGKGIGLVPSLEQVLTAFPERGFLIDVKGGDAEEAALIARRLSELLPGREGEIMVNGPALAMSVINERLPHLRTISRRRLKSCLGRYIALGWSGYIPSDCRRTALFVPANVAPWLWGWPNRFLRRMDGVGTRVFVIGDYGGEGFSQGVDDPEALERFPPDYAGGIWTNRIDLIGPAISRAADLRRRSPDR